jgi:hypothetical protein
VLLFSAPTVNSTILARQRSATLHDAGVHIRDGRYSITPRLQTSPQSPHLLTCDELQSTKSTIYYVLKCDVFACCPLRDSHDRKLCQPDTCSVYLLHDGPMLNQYRRRYSEKYRPIPIPADTDEYRPIPDTGIGRTLVNINCDELYTCTYIYARARTSTYVSYARRRACTCAV